MAGAGLDMRKLAKWGKNLRREDKKMERRIRAILEEEGARACAAAREGTPVETGRLRGGWRYETAWSGDGSLEIRLVNDVEYAASVEEGHVVKGAGGERWVPGRHMAEEALRQAGERLPRRIEKEMAARLKRL